MGSLNVEKNRVTSILRCKVVVVGAPTVGKTALCQMAGSSGSLFPKKYNMTVGVDVSVIPIRLEGTTEMVELFAYDVGGQDVFIDCCEEHLHDANYVVLCFNLYDQKTFDSLQDWLSLVLKSRKQTSDPPCGVLVGNKADLNQTATMVDVEGVRSWAVSSNFKYFEVSALPQEETWKVPFDYIAKHFKGCYEEFLGKAKNVKVQQ
ncbi:ras-like GTPase [Chloropicon primus]|uniref:Ras-like GTPase n=1 Tax=Chloropicon primus TaxID=1764295 RepID=A0A5B8MIH4_9CHLO|nr:ras-like GTPase [Chloropicon primus]|eukprot:QDZ20438.1 ras-like GTPase [Chloropicon primus]